MWPYSIVSRKEFERKKDYVETILRDLGCEVVTMKLPYEQRTTSYTSDIAATWFSQRSIYKYGKHYYRIDEVLFGKRPFIVLECAKTWDEVIQNRMEDADPFPFDLPDEEMIKEVKYSLGIEPYPDSAQ